MRWLESRALSQLGSVATWSVTGFALGLMFHVAGLVLLAITGHTAGVVLLHTQHPLLWLIDLAPFILAGAGYAIGTLVRRVAAAEENQRRLAAELARTWNLEIADRTHDMHSMAKCGIERAAAISHELRTPSRRYSASWTFSTPPTHRIRPTSPNTPPRSDRAVPSCSRWSTISS